MLTNNLRRIKVKKINKEVQKKVIGGRVTAREYNNTYPDITADGMIYNMMKDAEDIMNEDKNKGEE